MAALLGLTAPALTAESGSPLLPGETQCPYDLPAHRSWSEQETWIWRDRLCLGKSANLVLFKPSEGGHCDPQRADEWPDSRNLSPEFLVTLLLHQPYRDVLARHGVHIRCARFRTMVDLSSTVIDLPLWLVRSHFQQIFRLNDSQSHRLLVLSGSVFDDPVEAQRFQLNASLLLGDASFNGNVNLRGAEISGELVLSGSRFQEDLIADFLSVGRTLSMNGAYFQRAYLGNVDVGGQLDARGSSFEGAFHGHSLSVANEMFLSEDAVFHDLYLRAAEVGSDLIASNATFDGSIEAEGLSVGGALFLRDGTSVKDVNLSGASVSSHLQLRGSTFDGHLNLSGANIGGELHLTSPRPDGPEDASGNGNAAYPPPRWTANARLTLRNTYAEALNDTRDAWGLQPGRLDAVGFTYERLGGLRATRDSAMSSRSVEWLKDWLAKQEGFDAVYNPQPFEQLAKVLRDSGYPGKADAIMIYARNHERDSPSTSITKKFSLWLQWALIGYGYSNWIAIIWFLALTALGAYVCHRTAAGRQMSPGERYWFSFDMALPIIPLNKKHDRVELEQGIAVYFYFHKMFGFVLVSFLVAGLSGLTK